MRLNLEKKHVIAYAIGGGGWVLVDRLLLTFATVFYLPPGDPTSARIPEWSFLGVLTLWGAISLFGRIIDSVTDPLMAGITDRSTHPLGRRRFWMLVAIFPLCFFSALLFRPPDDGPTAANAVFAAVVLTCWYICYTIYNVPYTSLLADLARSAKDRLSMSIFQAVFQIIGAACVMIGGNILLARFNSVSPSGVSVATAEGYATLALCFAVFAAAWMLVPVLLIPERSLTGTVVPSKNSPFRDMKEVLESSQLRWFLLGTVAYWFGFNTVAQCVNYYVIVLMGKTEAFASMVLSGVFVVIGLTFPFVTPLARRFGRKKMMVVGALLQSAVLFFVPAIEDPIAGTAIMMLSGIPTCFVMSVPNSLLADLAEIDARRSGTNREAVVFAAQAFFLKVNLGVTTAMIAGLLTLGRSVENPLGIKLTGPAAGLVLLLSAFAYSKFDEPDEPEG